MSTASSSSGANIQSNGISKSLVNRASTSAAEDFVPHLNPHGLVIRMTEKKGRGVFGERRSARFILDTQLNELSSWSTLR